MIKYLFANNYKSLVNYKIEFNSLNVLIGKNGSGKTTVINLLTLLRDFIGGKESNNCFPNITLTRWMNNNIQTFEMRCLINDNHYYYHLEIEHNHDNSNPCIVLNETVKLDEHLLLSCKNGRVDIYNDDFEHLTEIASDMTRSGLNFIFQGKDNTLLFQFKTNILQNIIICSPDPKNMNILSTNTIDQAYPDYCLSNIVSVYAYLSQSSTETIISLWDKMKEINPNFVKTKADMAPFGKTLSFEYCYNNQNKPFYFSELSDGERMMFALYLLLYGFIKKGLTVLIDEPDNYLGLREIKPWCNELESICIEQGQCIMISHHPEVIDYFGNDSSIWMSRLQSGESVIADNPFANFKNETGLKYSEIIAGGYLDEI